MNIEAVGTSIATPPRVNEPGQQVEIKRQASQQNNPSSAEEQSKAQPEELLNQIKALTEDGVYSVRFEQESESHKLIVKIVDQESEEVIRQIPPEELLNLTKHLKELSGSIINTVS